MGVKPHHWPLVALGVSAAIAITAVIVIGSKSPAVNVPIMLGIPFVATYLAHLVSKRAPNKVLFEFRVDPRPSWYNDAVEVTDSGLEITAVSGGGRMASGGPTRLSYGFADLRGISTRQAVPGEAPWITLNDGRGLPVPAGDVVVLQTTTGEQVLPVDDPQKFVSLVRSRISSLPEVHSSPTVQTDGHLDEVGDAPPPTGDRTTPIEGPPVSLTGPSLAVRWLVGATLALTGTVVLPAVALITTPGMPLIVLTAAGVAGVVWVLNRNVPWTWGRVAFLSVPISVFWLIGKGGYLWVPVVLVLCPTLGYLGGRMFRLGANLGRNVEVRVPLRDGATLFVQRDRLVHKPTRSQAPGVYPQAMWLSDVTLTQPGTSPDVYRWPAPTGAAATVGQNPLLRLIARPQQWILPVTQAGELAELIRSRRGTPAMPTRMSVEEWRELRQWAVRRTVGMGRGIYAPAGIGWRLFAAAFTGQYVLMFLYLSYIGVDDVWVGILISVALTAWLLGDWWRVRPRMRVAEHNALPPGSRDWGETRPDHAPIPGWQPWR